MFYSCNVEYNGINFKSYLEMEWAKFFEKNNIKYIYEYKKFNLPSYRYIPDFYLVDYDIYFECKGELRNTSKVKIEELSKKLKKPVYIGYQNGNFNYCIWIDKDEYYFEKPEYSRLCLDKKFYGDDDNLEFIRNEKRKENLLKYETRIYEN